MNILLTAPYNEKERQVLKKAIGEIIYKPWKANGRAFNENELIDLLKESDAEALITEHDTVTGKVLDTFNKLKFIGVCRGTPSNVDIATASKYRIPVFYTPARNAQAVAEMFISNVVFLMRNTMPAIQWLEEEQWQSGAHDSYLQFKGNELAGKIIGMVGFGAIGRRIAQMTRSFPCYVKYYDPYVDEDGDNYSKCSLEEVFSTADIVSIHLPANKETRNMINSDLLSKMKRTALFVNTSRAMVVERKALLKALMNEKIKGAVLDVFNSEPPDELDYQLIHLPNVLATPHIAGATHEVEDHHAEIMNRNLLNWYVNHKEDESYVANSNAVAKTA